MSFVTPNMILVATNICSNKHKFCHNNFFCPDKHTFVVTKLVATKLFFAANICHDKSFVVTKYFCCDKSFVATKDMFCDDKTFVATKIILATAPTNDRCQRRRKGEWGWQQSCCTPLYTDSHLLDTAVHTHICCTPSRLLYTAVHTHICCTLLSTHICCTHIYCTLLYTHICCTPLKTHLLYTLTSDVHPHICCTLLYTLTFCYVGQK